MHAPDGFLTVGTAATTGALSAGTVALSLRRARDQLGDRQVPLAGIAAAFVFAAQMVNFPVAAGTTGHLLGGALAAILLGPAVGSIVVTVVVVVQALVFADGGLTALGYNVLNMAIVTSFGGYAVFRSLLRILPRNATGAVTAAGIAAGVSVTFSAMAFSIEWLFGATAPVPFDTVFGAVVGVHLLIGIGEGLITAMIVGSVVASRPDLVHGVHDIDRLALRRRATTDARGVILAGALVTIVTAAVISQFAASGPDGLQSAAAESGIEGPARTGSTSGSPFADYATAGLDNEPLSLAVAGIAGAGITLAVGFGVLAAVRDRGDRDPSRTRTG